MIRQGILVFADEPQSANLLRLRFGGLSLLDRGVRTLARAGAKSILVVVPQGVGARVSRLPRKIRSDVRIVSWGEPGAEILARDEDTLLLLGDHVHHHTSLTELALAGLEGADLVIHKGESPPQDLLLAAASSASDAVTFTEAGAPTEACSGAFLCSSSLAIHDLPASAADALCFIADRAAGKKVVSHPALPHLWRRVADKATGRQARDMLFGQVTKKTSGPVSRHLNARISIPFSKLLVETGISPHLVTVFFVLTTGLAGSYLITDPTSYPRVALAGLFWQLAAILDRCDGEVARVKLCESKFGAWFDTVTDNIAYVCAYYAIVVGIRRLHPGESLHLYAAISALVAMLLSVIILYTYAIKTGSGSLQNYLVGFSGHVPDQQKGFLHRMMERYAFLAKRDGYSFVIFLMALANGFEVIFWFMVSGLHLIALGVIISLGKMLASHPDRRPVASAPENAADQAISTPAQEQP